jgi:hypothetical protein
MSGSNDLKIGAGQRPVTRGPGDCQRAEMLMSLTKCGH